MPAPEPDPKERKYWPPPIWSANKKEEEPPRPEPAITRRITLPDTVTVGYLAQITGLPPNRIIDELCELHGYRGLRPVEFQDAARLLRRYGVGADRANT